MLILRKASKEKKTYRCYPSPCCLRLDGGWATSEAVSGLSGSLHSWSGLCCSGRVSRTPRRRRHQRLHVKPCQPPPARNARQTVYLSFLEMAHCLRVSVSCVSGKCCNHCAPLTWPSSLGTLISRLTKTLHTIHVLKIELDSSSTIDEAVRNMIITSVQFINEDCIANNGRTCF